MKLSEIIRRVIDLSTIVKHETETRQEDEGHGRLYDPFRVKREPSVAETTVRAFLSSQSAAVIYTITLIMYAGRGDFPIDDFMTQYEEMADNFPKPERAIEQMLEKVPLPDYLTEGLDMLAGQSVDVDTLL